MSPFAESTRRYRTSRSEICQLAVAGGSASAWSGWSSTRRPMPLPRRTPHESNRGNPVQPRIAENSRVLWNRASWPVRSTTNVPVAPLRAAAVSACHLRADRSERVCAGGGRPPMKPSAVSPYWADDPSTAVVLMYLESIGDPRRFATIGSPGGVAEAIVR